MNALIILRETHTAKFRQFFPTLHPALIPVCNKPLLDYLIDFSVLNHCKRLCLVMETLDPDIESRYGNGDRWGISITHGRINPETSIDQVLSTYNNLWDNSPVMVMDGFFFIHYDQNRYGQNSPRFFPNNQTSTGFLSSCATGSLILAPHADRLRNLSRASTALPFALAGMETLSDLYTVSMEIMGAQQAHYVFPGYKQENKVICGKDVHVHDQAVIKGPGIIGNHTRILKGAIIGPNAILGDRVMVDKNARIQHAMIFPHTYVGQQTRIYQNLVNGNQVFNANRDTLSRITDPTQLGSLLPDPLFSVRLLSQRGTQWLARFNPFTA